ncbi:hypothetical protein HDU97_002259 [Phlyctochytrium planicorne]|nr:hypothetical protein HDU97_002259 [Phlyctochytrium planicorne]
MSETEPIHSDSGSTNPNASPTHDSTTPPQGDPPKTLPAEEQEDPTLSERIRKTNEEYTSAMADVINYITGAAASELGSQTHGIYIQDQDGVDEDAAGNDVQTSQVLTLSQGSLSNNEQVLKAIKTISKAAGELEGAHKPLAAVLQDPEIGKVFQDPRLDPRSDKFDNKFSMQVMRQFAKAMHLEWPEMPVVFKDLVILGDSVNKTEIPTVADPLRNLMFPFVRAYKFFTGINKTFFPPKLPTAKTILHSMTGVIQPGECVLVIGRPGSGCSTLLRALANRNSTFKEIKGTLLHAGLTSEEVNKRFRGDINFAEENDPHYPSLTVRQTLDFALKCRINNALLRNRIIEVTLRMYGLVNCQNTVVGNEQIRGVSGGEKKRVSLAVNIGNFNAAIMTEASCVGGCLGVFDGCTKGLDSASAFDFIKGLRNIADFQGRTVVASCYQASDAMFELFDKVIVMAEGHCTYFGPVKDAVSYFEGLDGLNFKKHPRATKAEFLTSCSSSPSTTAEDLAARYESSSFGEKMRQAADDELDPDIIRMNRHAYVHAISKFKGITGAKSRKNDEKVMSYKTVVEGEIAAGGNTASAAVASSSMASFSISVGRQMMLLLQREVQILRGNPLPIIIRLVFTVVMAIIVGSVFLQLPKDSSGAYTRGGAIFFGLLFNSVSALSDIPKIMEGRPILYKHTASALYRPSTLFLAQYMTAASIDIILILLFSVVLYNMVGLQASVPRFFFFYLTLVISSQAFGVLIKIIGNSVATKEAGNQFSGTVLILCVLYNGYMIVRQDMVPWFGWIYHVNPLSYGFRSLMLNEFDGLQLDCSNSPTSIIPYGPGFYTDPNHQTCTLAGAKAGQSSVDGLSYLSTAYGFDLGMIWWNLVINAGLWCVFMVVNVIIVENVQHGKPGVSIKLYKTTKEGKSGEWMQDGAGQWKKVHPSSDPELGAEDEKVSSNGGYKIQEKDYVSTLTWTDLVYKVPHPKERGAHLQLLDHVCGYALPGTMTALMGSSGAGKTTLLDVVARRKTIGKIEGQIMMGNKPQDSDFLKITGYCEQMDVHNRNSTVREALRFAATLRQPKSVAIEDKFAHVEHIIELLELQKISDALIGDLESGVGLSMEERKRLTIGVELSAKPKILFLDEPTSGLDDQASANILRLLRNLAMAGHALVVTIHQPSSTLFSMFDRLLLLGRGGKMIYFGDLGQDCKTLISYFERNGAHPCDPAANPAEYILECIGAGTAKTSNPMDWSATWNKSPESQHELSIIKEARGHAESYATANPAELAEADRKLTHDTLSGVERTNLVMKRMFKSFYRSPEYNLGRIGFQISAGLIIGLSFFQVAQTPAGAQNRVFALFMTSVLGVVLINLALPVFISQREFASREVTSGTYKPISFGLAMTTVEVPFTLLAASAFFFVFYWAVGLGQQSEQVLCFYVSLCTFTLWAVSFGQMMASLAPNLQIASSIVPLCTSILSLFSGVTVPYNSMPLFYRNWLYWIDPYHYFIETLFVNDLHNLALSCDDRSTVRVTPPTNTTCETYFKPYLTKAPGYLMGTDSLTGTCRYCPMSMGDTMFLNFSWSFENRWRNVFILLGFFVFNRLMTFYFVSRFKERR